MSTNLEKIKAKHPNIKPQDAEDLKVINESLQDLFKLGTFVSRDPYVLTIPQDTESLHRHRNRYQERQFAHNTPFNHDEREDLQYQTYKYYDPARSLFKQFPSTEESKPPSAVNTPVHANEIKNRMSLGAYKKLKLGSSPAPKVDRTPNKVTNDHKSESAAILAGVDEEPATAPTVEPSKVDKQESDTKRKRDENETNGAAPASKRARADVQDNTASRMGRESEDPARALPKKLSPLREQQLPARLSPTLPDVVESALIERRERKHRHLTNGDAENGDSVRHEPTRPVRIVKLPLKRAARENQKPSDSASESTRNIAAADNKSNSTAREDAKPSARTPITTSSPEAQKLATPSIRKTGLTNGTTHTPEPSTPSVNGKQRLAKTAAQLEWTAERKRLEDLGRELKHSATACARATPPQPERAALRALQSFMCYLLAFTCADQQSLCAEPPQVPVLNPWRSLEPFSKFVQEHCTPYPALTGLAWTLCHVYNSHLLALIESTPADMPSRDSLVGITTLLRSAAKQAHLHLSGPTIRREFPAAWKAAVKDGFVDEQLKAGRLLQGDYPLPVTLLTTPVQAVRAAVAIVEEWIAQKGIEENIALEP